MHLFYTDRMVMAPSAPWRKETTEAELPLLPKASVLYYILPKNRSMFYTIMCNPSIDIEFIDFSTILL